MEKWVVAAKRADFNRIGKIFGIDPVVARIIRNRNMTEEEQIRQYLHGTRKDMYDPHLLKDAEKAAEIILQKIEQKKKIRIIGDYDIDGVNATLILLKGLRRCGAIVDAAIPDRIKDGYGLNRNLVEQAMKEQIDTIVTCDNGIAAIDEINYGKANGMTIIVTDHHDIPYQEGADGSRHILQSEADAIVNPKQDDCKYPFSGICGAVVAFKLIEILYEKAGVPGEEAEVFLEYAAFATVGDVMELQSENRIIVKLGLERIHHTTQPGLKALILKNDLELEHINSYHFGFVLGPCINASGRLDTAKHALKLLLCEDEKEAGEIAEELIRLNQSRKDMTLQGVEEAIQQIEACGYEKDKVMVIYLPQCHESLAGIIAGRIRERYHHPVFVLTKGEECVKGSGRSIEQYSRYEDMVKCRDLCLKFGGHPMAAGLSIPEEKVEEFRRRINENATLKPEDFVPKIVIDVPMPLEYINFSLIQQLAVLEPFGKGNEKPIFAEREIKPITAQVLGKSKNVLKMKIRMKNMGIMDAIYFGEVDALLGYIEEKFGADQLAYLLRGENNKVTLSIVYYPTINEFRGQRSLQVVIQHYR